MTNAPDQLNQPESRRLRLPGALRARIAIALLAFICLLGVIGFLYTRYGYLRLPEASLFTSAQVAAHRGDQERAVMLFKRLIAKDPRNSFAHVLLAESQLKLNDLTGAVQTYEALTKLDPKPAHWRKLLELFRQTGALDKARAIELQHAVLLDQKN